MRPLQDVIQEYRVLFSANCASNTAYGHWDGKIALPLTLSHQSSDGMQGRGKKTNIFSLLVPSPQQALLFPVIY